MLNAELKQALLNLERSCTSAWEAGRRFLASQAQAQVPYGEGGGPSGPNRQNYSCQPGPQGFSRRSNIRPKQGLYQPDNGVFPGGAASGGVRPSSSGNAVEPGTPYSRATWGRGGGSPGGKGSGRLRPNQSNGGSGAGSAGQSAGHVGDSSKWTSYSDEELLELLATAAPRYIASALLRFPSKQTGAALNVTAWAHSVRKGSYEGPKCDF